jgi:hypothetical protein
MALLNWLRNLWLTLLASTRYAAVGGTSGALLGMLALWLDRNAYTAFFLGAARRYAGTRNACMAHQHPPDAAEDRKETNEASHDPTFSRP